jgi:hypothetical protein
MLKHQTEETGEHDFKADPTLTNTPTAEETEQTETAATDTNRTTDTLLVTLERQLRLQKWLHIGAGVLFVPLLLFFLVTLWSNLAPQAMPPLLQAFLRLYPFQTTRTVPRNAPEIEEILGPPSPDTSAVATITTFDMVTPALLTLGCIVLAAMARRQRGKITRILAEKNDVRAIGPLAQALEIGNKHVAIQATEALLRLLPQIQSADASLLDAQQRACLHRALRGKNTELALAILEAFERIGDTRDLTVVQQLAQSAKDTSVREAAQRILPALQQSVKQQTEAQTLLRGSQRSTSADPAELLRGILPDKI